MNLGLAGEFNPAFGVVESGLLVSMLDGIDELLAASPTFMAACDLDETDPADRAQAIATRIHWDYFDDEEAVPNQTHAIVVDDSGNYESTGEDESLHLQAGERSVILLLSRPSLPTADHDAAKLDFANWATDVIEEIAANCGAAYYPFESIQRLGPPARTPRMHRRPGLDFWWVRYRLTAHGI
jgi:hypothetical protein